MNIKLIKAWFIIQHLRICRLVAAAPVLTLLYVAQTLQLLHKHFLQQ